MTRHKYNPRPKRPIRPALRVAAFFILLAPVLFAGCAATTARQAAPAPFAGPVPQRTFLNAAGRVVAPAELARLARNAEYVLLGESHANACDHEAQAEILEALAASNRPPALGLEMLPAGAQDRLAALADHNLPPAALAERLDWKTNWGYDFALYQPVFAVAQKYGLPAYALNADKNLVAQVSRNGLDSLSPLERSRLPGEIIPPPKAQETFLAEQFQEHQRMLAAKAAQQTGKKGKQKPSGQAAQPTPKTPPPDMEKRLAAFFAVQSLWDSQMAQRAVLARALSGRPVAVIVGGGHVEHGWGLAHRLRRLDPGARILTVMPWRGGQAPEAGEADFFFLCPLSMKTRLGFTLEFDEPQNAAPTFLVSAVEQDSPAARAGLMPQDALTAAGDAPLASAFDLHKAALAARDKGAPLVLTVRRGDETLTLSIEIKAQAPGQ